MDQTEPDEGTVESRFDAVDEADPEEEVVVRRAFVDDSSKNKVDLSFTDLRNDEGSPWILPMVRSVEKQMALDRTLNHEYLPIFGQFDFRLAGIHLLLGKENVAVIEGRVDSIQSIDITGAIRVGLNFLSLYLNFTTIYTSSLCTENICNIASALNYTIKEYRYWDKELCWIDFEGMLDDLKNAPDCSVIMLSLCGHNPTGCDLTMEEWKCVADVLKEKNVFVFFYCSSQGLCSGDLDTDAAPLRLFVRECFELFVAQSFSVTFGLYAQSVGQLAYVVRQPEDLFRFTSQLSAFLFGLWENPPQHGGRIVAAVLNNSALSMEWRECVRAMALQLCAKRQMLYLKLKVVGAPGCWDHIVRQRGLFSVTGFNPLQVECLRTKHHIYLTANGRINISGITSKNVNDIANAFRDVISPTEQS